MRKTGDYQKEFGRKRNKFLRKTKSKNTYFALLVNTNNISRKTRVFFNFKTLETVLPPLLKNILKSKSPNQVSKNSKIKKTFSKSKKNKKIKKNKIIFYSNKNTLIENQNYIYKNKIYELNNKLNNELNNKLNNKKNTWRISLSFWLNNKLNPRKNITVFVNHGKNRLNV